MEGGFDPLAAMAEWSHDFGAIALSPPDQRPTR
jgi:hypothetical protein